MTRYIAPLAVVFALATTAHAQNYVTQSYNTTDAYGNSVTTTVQAPSSAVGLIAGQAFSNNVYGNGGYVNGGYVNGGYANGGGYVNGGFNVYYGGSTPTYYGNYPSPYYGGYAGYPGYGYGNYGNYPVYQSCPPTYISPPSYGYVRPAPSVAPRTYVPGQDNRTAPTGPLYGSMAILPNTQGAPYGSPPYNYGLNNRGNGGERRGRNR